MPARSKTALIPKLIAIVSLLWLAGFTRLQAANGPDAWTGAGGSANWNTAGNWTGANTPPLAGDSLVFGTIGSIGASLTNNYNTPSNSFGGITFNATAGAFTLKGNALTNSAAIIDNSTNLEIINLALVFPATQLLTPASGATLKIGGVISGPGGLTVNGAGTLMLTNANIYAGGTTVNAGTLKLDFSGASSAPAANILPVTALALGGGTLSVIGSTSVTSYQTNSGVTIGATGAAGAASAVSVTNNAVLSLGTITTTTGSSLVFNGPATINGAGNVAAIGTILVTTAGQGPSTAGVDGVLASGANNNSYATVGLYDWASVDTTGGTAGTSPYTIIGGSQVSGFYVTPGNNADLPGGVSTAQNNDISTQQTPAFGGTSNVRISTTGTTIADTIRFNSGHAPYITVKGGDFLCAGGVLITPNMGAMNGGLDDLRLQGAGCQIVQNNTAAVFCLGLNGQVPFFSNANNGAETAVFSGPGTVFLNPVSPMNIAFNYLNSSSVVTTSSTGTYNSAPAASSTWGAFYLNGGVTVINSGTALGNPTNNIPQTAGGQGTVNLNGGTLMAAYATNTAGYVSLTNAPFTGGGFTNRPVFLGNNGGGLAAQSNTTFNVGGLIENTAATAGALVIGIPASAANGNVAGLVPGTGPGTSNSAFYATGTVVLTNANGYTGGTVIDTGTLIINGVNALGGGNYGGLTFNGGSLQYAAGSANGSLDLSGATSTIALAANATIDFNGNTVTFANPIGGGGALTLLSSGTAGSLTLSGASTYTGGTTLSNLTVTVNNLTGSATGTNVVNVLTNTTLTDNGTITGNVTVTNGATVGGTGTFAGNVTVSSGGQTLPGSSGATNIITGNLTYGAGAKVNFYLGSTAAGGGNDQILLNGTASTLTCGSNSVGINCGSFLDQTHDYVLFKLTGGSAGISGGFSNTPAWLGTVPAGSASYVVLVTNSTQVVLHYAASSTPPVITATNSSPNPVVANQPLTLTATVTAGSGTINPATGVTVNLTSIGGSATQPLISDGAGHYTNTVTIGNGYAPGGETFVVTVTDSLGSVITANLPAVLNAATDIWNGGGVGSSSNWSNNTNWVSGYAPGSADSLIFAGSTGLAPVMNSSYTLAAVTFSNTAGAFTVGNAGGSVLTLTGGVTNDSASAEILNVPVVLSVPVTLNAAAGGLTVSQNITNGGNQLTVTDGGSGTTLSGAVSGGGGVVMAGSGTASLSGVNTYTGGTTISSGTVAVTGAGQLGGGNYAAGIVAGGTFTYGSSAAQILSGILSGSGTLNQNGSGTLTLAASNTFGGNAVIAGGTLLVSNPFALQNASLNYNNQGGNLGFAAGLTAATLGTLSGAQNLTLNNAAGAGVTLTVGNNNVATNYSGALSGFGSLTVGGTAAFTLTGTNTLTGTAAANTGVLQVGTNGILACGTATTFQSGGGELIVSGGTLVVTNGSTIGAGSLGLLVDSGSATFLGSLGETLNQNLPDLIQVNGGTLQAASLTLGRTALVSTTQPAAGTTNTGLYVNGGAVNITGNLDMCSSYQANSSVSARVDGGSLTVGGTVTIGLANGGRWSVLDLNGGTITVTNTTTGISVGGPNPGNAELLVRAGTLNAGIIGLGYGIVTDTAALYQSGGSLYVGSGGIVQVSPNVTPAITLAGGVLGASTDWSSALPMQLTGTGFAIKTANASGVAHDITLNGVLSGTGSLTLNGNGTLKLGATNTWSGPTAVSNGVLLVNGTIGTNAVTVAAGAALGGTGIVGGAVTYNSGSYAVFTPGLPLTFTNAVTVASGGTLPVVELNLSAGLGAGTYVLATNLSAGIAGTFNGTPVILAGSAGSLLSGATATVATAGNLITLTISKADPFIATAPSAGNLSYGQALSASALTGGSVTNAAGTAVSGIFAYTAPATVPNAGTAGQSVTFTPVDTADYNAVTGTASVTVTPAPLGVTAGNTNKVYDGVTFSGGNGVTYSGFVNGQNASVLGGSLSYAGTAQGAVAPGSYTIVPSGLTAANYSISYTNGTLTISQAPPAITLGSSLNPAGYLGSVSFTASLPADATGSMVFSSTNGPISTNTLTGGAAGSSAVTNLARGVQLITVVYGGDGNYLAGTNTFNQTVTNHPPVAGLMIASRTAGLFLELSLSDLATNWTDADGDPVSLTAINLTTTNGVSLFPIGLATNLDGSYITTNGAFLGYVPGADVADRISYSISDGQGGTNIGYINIVVVSPDAGTNSITGLTGGNPNGLTAYGVPGFNYITERSTNLTDWVEISTNTAATNGVINVIDAFSDLGSNAPSAAYYRLLWQP